MSVLNTKKNNLSKISTKQKRSRAKVLLWGFLCCFLGPSTKKRKSGRQIKNVSKSNKHTRKKNVNKFNIHEDIHCFGAFLFDFLKRDFPHQRTTSTTTQSRKFFSNSCLDFSFSFLLLSLTFFCCISFFSGCCCFRKINTT